MKVLVIIFCSVVFQALFASDDLLRSQCIIPSDKRDTSPITNAETDAALQNDTDIQSIHALYCFLNTVQQQENGKLKGNSLKQIQAYWENIEPIIRKKFHAQKRYGLEIIDTITQSLSITLEETNATTVYQAKDIDCMCTIRTYALPIHINNDIRGFKATIANIFNTLIKEHTWCKGNKHNPYPINLFPHTVNNYLVFNTPQKCAFQTPVASPPLASDTKSQTIPETSTSFNPLDDAYRQKLDEEDTELYQLPTTKSFLDSSLLKSYAENSDTDSERYSTQGSLANSIVGSTIDSFEFKTPPQARHIRNNVTFSTFKNKS